MEVRTEATAIASNDGRQVLHRFYSHSRQRAQVLHHKTLGVVIEDCAIAQTRRLAMRASE